MPGTLVPQPLLPEEMPLLQVNVALLALELALLVGRGPAPGLGTLSMVGVSLASFFNPGGASITTFGLNPYMILERGEWCAVRLARSVSRLGLQNGIVRS